MNIFFIKLINMYKKYISPYTGNNCKHYPSCSTYGVEAMEQYPFYKSFPLLIFRLLRCNPWSLGGYDPVPKQVKLSQPSSFKIMGNYQNQLYK